MVTFNFDADGHKKYNATNYIQFNKLVVINKQLTFLKRIEEVSEV